jgi:hypothetical protein
MELGERRMLVLLRGMLICLRSQSGPNRKIRSRLKLSLVNRVCLNPKV